jgi:protein-arginine kinase activator protein McsA
MSTSDLNDLLNEVLENEDYIKAIEIRDELKKRKGKK